MALIRSITSLGLELGRIDESFSGVYIVVERGDGSKRHPYSGEIIDCKDREVTPEFVESFKAAWWEGRRPSLGLPPHVAGLATKRKRGSGDDSSGGSSGARAGQDGDVANLVVYAGPPFALHEPAVLLSAKSQDMGELTLTKKMVTDVLHSVRLTSLAQMTTLRVKSLFKHISATMNPRCKGRKQWTWPQLFPLELLTNQWVVEGDGDSSSKEESDKNKTIIINAACLYPPWHNIVKTGYIERRLAVILAASLSDVWMFHLCLALNVEWTADHRSKLGSADVAAAAALGALTKKRGRSPNEDLGNDNKKTRVTHGPKNCELASAPASTAAAAGGSTSNRPLQLVLQEADSCSLRSLADATVVAVTSAESSVIENAWVTDEERVLAAVVSETSSVLLPFPVVVECMGYFSTNVDVTASTTSDAVLKVKSTTIPTTTITRASAMNMLAVHTYNKDVLMVQEAFSWLRPLEESLDYFPLDLGPVFSPKYSVAAIAVEVKQWLSDARVDDDAWRYFEEAAGGDGAQAGCRAYGGQTVSVREVVSSCRPSWLTSVTINAAMVELRLSTRLVGGYALLTEQMASLLRIDGKLVELEAAQTAAAEVAAEVGGNEWLGTVINLCNSHWVSAVIDVKGREVVVYDSLPGGKDPEMKLAVQRVILLCDAVVNTQAAAPGWARHEWKVTTSAGPIQPDGHSCGVFAVAHVVCALSGYPLSAVCPRADLLRLAFIHHVLSRGRQYKSARLTLAGPSQAYTSRPGGGDKTV